jgi:hypothetical protein
MGFGRDLQGILIGFAMVLLNSNYFNNFIGASPVFSEHRYACPFFIEIILFLRVGLV